MFRSANLRSMIILAIAMGLVGCGTTWHSRLAAHATDDQQVHILRVPDDVRRPADDRRPDPAVVARLVHDRVNAHRREQHRSDVTPDPLLVETADQFARYMADTGRYGHTADGKTPAERVAGAGYEFCLVSENLGYLFNSDGYEADELAKAFVTGWIDSPGHHRNMIDPDVTQTGIAIARTEAGEYFAVQVFARPESARIQFALRNTTTAPIRYDVDGKAFDLAPRATRTHTGCRRPAVVLHPTGRKLDIGDGGTFEVFNHRAGDTLVRRVR